MAKYQAHCSDIGWQDPVNDGQVAGTIGENRALECIRILDLSIPDLGIHGFAHVQNVGWSNGNVIGEDIGSTGQGLPIEAIKIGLIGGQADNYDIWYRLHIQDKGFLNWSKNGAINGSIGLGLKAQAIQIEVHGKSENWYPVVDTNETFIEAPPGDPTPAVDRKSSMLALAKSYVGYVTGTSNDSVFGRRYDGINAGSWCCYSVRSICDDNGIYFPATGYCPYAVDDFKNRGKWKTSNPEPGDVVFYDFNGNGTADHVGIVSQVISGGIKAYEGNTVPDGGGAIGYYERTRYDGILGYGILDF